METKKGKWRINGKWKIKTKKIITCEFGSDQQVVSLLLINADPERGKSLELFIFIIWDCE